MAAPTVCEQVRSDLAAGFTPIVEEAASVSTHAVLVVTRNLYPLIADRPAAVRLGAVCWFVVLILALGGCGGEGQHDSKVERDSVIQHWTELFEIEDSLERTAAMAQFVTSLEPADADAIGEILTTRYGRNRAIDELILWNAWSRLDPAAAAARALVVRTPLAQSLRADVVLEWALRDPRATAAFFEIDERPMRIALVRGWYASGAPGLSEYVLTSDPGRFGQDLLGLYTAELSADKGAEAVAGWLDSIRGQSEITQIVITNAHRKGIMAMAMADPEAAIAYCEIHCDGRYGNTMRQRLAERLGVLGEAKRAVIWLEGAVDADQIERGQAARQAVRSWLRSDFDAALDWADEAFGKYKDESWFLPPARLVLTVYSRRDPNKALDWVDIFTDPQDREDALVRIARRWLELDEQAAESWLETSPLDPEAREKARTPQKTRSGP
jgi:hypothetical protein